MAALRVIITGATGMVGEGVLFECLENENISDVLLVSRRHYDVVHPKVKELLVPDFLNLADVTESLCGYDACFFCAGVSSVGMKEDRLTLMTYDTTLAFAKTVLGQNPRMVFTYVSGAKTDSTEKGRLMWARVKGKTENDLMKLPFKAEYNFRPGAMLPFNGQKNWNKAYRVIAKILRAVAPKSVLTMKEVGRAMINAVMHGYPKQVLEVSDIWQLAQQR